MVKVNVGCGKRSLSPKSVNGGKPRIKRTYVYIIFGAGLCKVGIASNVDLRLANLQSSCPVKLTLLAYWYSPTPIEDERLIHSNLKEYHAHGEWFRIPIDVVKEIVTDRIIVTERKQALLSYLKYKWESLFS